mgnify:FL=1
MSIKMHKKYRENGFRVFGLHGVTSDNECACGNKSCQNKFKHPKHSGWQNTPHYSNKEFNHLINKGDFKTGFGVLCNGYLVIDIDPRNGGNEGFAQLVEDTGIDFKKDSEFTVETGGGGWHLYYKYSGEEKLHSNLNQYNGVDFKSSGFVVGADSWHISGMQYKEYHNNIEGITELPDVLKDILTKPKYEKNFFQPSRNFQVEESKVVELLKYVDNEDYSQWIQVGMIIHESLGEHAFDVWNNWSSTSEKHNESDMHMRWGGFGKSKDKVTIGTLVSLAKAEGYIEKVTFEYDEAPEPEEHLWNLEIEKTPDGNIDHKKAPGLVGEFIDYINAQSRYPRENLAVSAALMAVSNIGGMRFEDEFYGVTPNLFCFNVAGSATGKEAIQQAQNELMFAAGMGKVCYGTIKSEQEIYRNMTRNQAACYTIDEWGIQLKKITQGTEGYLGGVVGALMQIYSKADKKLPLGADFAGENIALIRKQVAAINKKIDSNEDKDYDRAALKSAEKMLEQLNNGHIANPFISLSGYSTQSTFNDLMTYEQATNGFIGRALLFEEKNNNPRIKEDYKKTEISDYLKAKILTLRNGGNYEVANDVRVEFTGKMTLVKTKPETVEMLKLIQRQLHDTAELALDKNGLEAIIRRSFELILKVSLILAMGDGLIRTSQHVEWAHSMVLNDMNNKLTLTAGNRAADEDKLGEEIENKVLQKLDKETGITIGTLANKMRKIDKDNIQKCLDFLVGTKKARFERIAPKRGPEKVNYYLL